MKTKAPKATEQPAPFTPGITKANGAAARLRIIRDKPARRPLTLGDWVLAEKDLIGHLETEASES